MISRIDKKVLDEIQRMNRDVKDPTLARTYLQLTRLELLLQDLLDQFALDHGTAWSMFYHLGEPHYGTLPGRTVDLLYELAKQIDYKEDPTGERN